MKILDIITEDDQGNSARDAYKAQARDQRIKQNSSPAPEQLVPLNRVDEDKVRQLAKRMSEEHAIILGETIGNIIKGGFR